MRLWHEDIIDKLPDRKTSGDPKKSQLNGLHRECCGMRGKGWGKKGGVVGYVWKYPYAYLYLYHKKVMHELLCRGYNIDRRWLDSFYRGKKLGYDYSLEISGHLKFDRTPIFPEHDEAYLQECIDNLRKKGVEL